MRCVLSAAGAALLMLAATPSQARSLLDYVGQCVPFARAVSGIQIFGDAWTWWGSAAGRYVRGGRPREGAVLVFRQTERMKLGHVSVVSRVVDDRVVMVTHANWSRFDDGRRGRVEQDVTMSDVSERGDWSRVRVWYRGSQSLGGSTYPTYGFIQPERTDGGAVASHSDLTGTDPDYVGSLIDAYR